MVVSPICCSVSPSWSKLIGNTGGGGRKGDEGWRVDRCSGQESGAETDFGACITVRRCRGSCFSLRKAKPRRSLWNTEQRDKMIVDNGAAAVTSRPPRLFRGRLFELSSLAHCTTAQHIGRSLARAPIACRFVLQSKERAASDEVLIQDVFVATSLLLFCRQRPATLKTNGLAVVEPCAFLTTLIPAIHGVAVLRSLNDAPFYSLFSLTIPRARHLLADIALLCNRQHNEAAAINGQTTAPNHNTLSWTETNLLRLHTQIWFLAQKSSWVVRAIEKRVTWMNRKSGIM